MKQQPKTLFENVQALRKLPETCYVGYRYSNKDDADIRKDIKNGISIADIAKKQKRTISAIRQRVIMFAIDDMRSNNRTLEDVSRMYNMNISRLSSYYQRICEKEKEKTKNIRDLCNQI